MILNLDPLNPVPIYLQIVDQVRRLIALGALRPGERIPAVRDLAAQCRINRNTAARAIQELERAGVVRTQVGQGTFIAEEPPPADASEDVRAVDAQCDRLIVEARARQVPLEQLPSRLWSRIDAFRREAFQEEAALDIADRPGQIGTTDPSAMPSKSPMRGGVDEEDDR